ncbi:unnamed protein product [Hydatigera taeniaeformis]|uniref:Uncharacterized protein n=1 Tax=Hydatigena taeniaeformis TaxID=6205 RepID=A0A0R3WX07_HYDTA|nr:unnamed protein product [Hydatigera taeniaeformis]
MAPRLSIECGDAIIHPLRVRQDKTDSETLSTRHTVLSTVLRRLRHRRRQPHPVRRQIQVQHQLSHPLP